MDKHEEDRKRSGKSVIALTAEFMQLNSITQEEYFAGALSLLASYFYLRGHTVDSYKGFLRQMADEADCIWDHLDKEKG